MTVKVRVTCELVARRYAPDKESSSAGESHPHALTESDMRLAPHPAPTIQLRTDVKAGERQKFVYSHIDDCGSIAVAVQDSGISIYILIRKIGRQVVACVDGGRPLLEMIVALSGIGEKGISGDIAVCPCPIGAIPAIGHSAAAKDIVAEDRLILVV